MYCLIILFSILICNNALNYTLTTTFTPNTSFDTIKFSSDQYFLAMYSSAGSSTFRIYLGRTYQPHRTYTLDYNITVIVFSQTTNNKIAYGGKTGKICHIVLDEDYNFTCSIINIIADCDISLLGYSKDIDQKYLAVGCKENMVIILDAQSSKLQILYNVSLVKQPLSLSWSVDQLLMITCEQLSSIFIFSINNRTLQEVSTDYPPSYALFTPNNSLIIYCSKQTELLQILNTADYSYQSSLIAYRGQRLSSMTISKTSSYLIAAANQFTYVWSLINQSFIIKLPNNLTQSLLSANGGTILTSNTSHILVYQLCSQPMTTYNPQTDTCLHCIQGCSQCFEYDKLCLSCQQRYYLEDHNCLHCVEYCLKCNSIMSCERCQDGYYPETGICLSCVDVISGCLLCNTADKCQRCDSVNKWEISNQGHCRCIDRYVQIGTICMSCPIGCLHCDEKLLCMTCDQQQNRKEQPLPNGTCECIQGFYGDDCLNNCGIGCTSCQTGDKCDTCNIVEHFIVVGNQCRCEDGYVLVNPSLYHLNQFSKAVCTKCSEYLIGCKRCTSTTSCQQCADTFIYDPDSYKCYCPVYRRSVASDTDKCDAPDPTPKIIGIVVGSLVFAAIVIFIIYKIKRKRTMLETVLTQDEPTHEENRQP